MKTTEPYRTRAANIRSLKDLEREKEKLQLEILRKEDNIRHNYQNLVHLLSFRNLLGSLLDELNSSATVISRLITFGKGFFDRRKKRKKSRHETGNKTE